MEPLTPSSTLSDSTSSKHYAYSRKQKSLGLLCSNFLSLYNRDGINLIGLDDAASKLGVERRRIYDIVNVLESVGVLARKAKNQYSWKGFQAIPQALQELKDSGFRDNFCTADSNDCEKVSHEEEDDEGTPNLTPGSQNSISNVPKPSASQKSDNRREKSLALLTQNFVKLFVCSNADMISLDDAAKLLLGDAHNASIMRTKVRRLYDIANVLSSMDLIEKTHAADTRKPVFRWLGLGGKVQNQSANKVPSHESRKRTFGSEITNIDFKRNKVEKDMDQLSQIKHRNFGHEVERSSMEDCKQSLKNIKFGPFAPASVAKVDVSENNNGKLVPNWEGLASTYRPQYQNQALRELFSHYMEAWKSWYSEAVKKPKKIS